MTWNETKPAITNQVSADIPDIWENFDEVRDIIEAITNGTVGSTASSAFAVEKYLFTKPCMFERKKCCLPQLQGVQL